MSSSLKIVRCAIYTRKSSEDGLDQNFNSLHAQREACENYIKSQRHEGWSVISKSYDDGGYSGGTLKRPAMAALLSDIKRGMIDVVVVYKVDRLTRSLIDFSRIVEILDSANVSFVSITQQFNTTSPMGRLTLNVLLSFAQFEREVTGERIRDKVRASKAKGMWMGGRVPFGYKVVEKKLIIDEAKSELISRIFNSYVSLKSISKVQILLATEYESEASPSADRKSKIPNKHCTLNRSKLYGILNNPIYKGKIRLGEALVDGLHQPIISEELYKSAQDILTMNYGFKSGNYKSGKWLLKGKLFNADGRLYSIEQIKLGKVRKYYYADLPCRNINGINSDRIPCERLENLFLKISKSLLQGKFGEEFHLKVGYRGINAHKNVRGIIDQCSYTISPREFIDRFLKKVEVTDLDFKLEFEFNPDSTVSIFEEKLDNVISCNLTVPNPFYKIRTELKQYYRNDNRFINTWIKMSKKWFFDDIIQHETSISQIANSTSLSADCVGNNIILAFLSPKIVKHIQNNLDASFFSKAKLLEIVSKNYTWSKQEVEYFKICGEES